jgi:hypothetical protein
MNLHEIPFSALFEYNFTAANLSPRHLSRSKRCDAPLRAQIVPPCHWRAILLFFLSCCLPFILSGCAGGRLIANAANSESFQATPNKVTFGGVPMGQTASTPVSLVNQLSTAVQVSQINVTGQSFSASGASDLPIKVAAGGTYNFYVNFSPAAMGAAAGQVTITSNSPTNGALVIGLNGTGTAANTTTTTNLSSLSCAGGSITGAGTDSCTVALNAAAPSSGFSVSLASNSSAVTVPASVTVAAGSTTASFTATVSSVSTAQTVTLTASASGVMKTFALQLGAATPTPALTPALSVNAANIAFGDVDLNSPATQSLILSSTGSAAVTVGAATLAGTGFTVSGATFPLTLNPSQTATLSVEFDPTAAGAVFGSLTLTSNSCTGSSTVITLTGTGDTASTSYEVSLTWDAPSSSFDPVAGYNVYRSPSGGTSYQQLNTSTITQTSYVDTTVSNGQTYDYIVESVDASGVTSTPSNMASANIP